MPKLLLQMNIILGMELGHLDIKRSSPVAAEEGVPQVYRFALGNSGPAVVPIQWEIPELGEIVKGYTDGKPMTIHRTDPTPGLTLAVRTDGRRVLLYEVLKDGKLFGAGRMMLVDDGRAWIDLTWPQDRQDMAVVLTYVKYLSDHEGVVVLKPQCESGLLADRDHRHSPALCSFPIQISHKVADHFET